ncbi:RNA polymerase sigma factor [Microbacterium sp. NPDC055903]
MAARPEAARAAGILKPRAAERLAHRRRVFDWLFEEFWSPVTRHVECYLGTDAEVYEVVGQVFQLAWERLRPERPARLTWLLRLADDVLRDRRRRGTLREQAIGAVHQKAVTGEENGSTLGPREVRSAFARLRERERRVIVLLYWDALTVEEAGEVIRRAPGVVRAIDARAREKLRKAWEGAGGENDG